jgi:prevent-host-death family protein
MNKRTTVNIHEAKSNLSKLVEQVETGARAEVVIARAGKPVARLVPVARATIKLGIADGTFPIPANIDALNPMIEQMFMTSSRSGRAKNSKTKRRS